MVACDSFWKFDHLSNQQLLEGLGNALRAKRRALAELVAHLGEVEERRLHLEAAYGSLFEYCVRHWGMSEDEACRRIELARLARQFPQLLSQIASGELSLSVALLLKPMLTQDNHAELVGAACGKSVREVRELLAARYPRPDVASNIRKLPERRDAAPSVGLARSPDGAAPKHPIPASIPAEHVEPVSLETSIVDAEHSARAASVPSITLAPSAGSRPAPPSARDRIEPLSAQRYKVQFTADVALKEKLELARDLLRHANPDGDFAPMVERALDLLIADLQRRRFGAGARREGKAADQRPASSAHRAASPSEAPRPASAHVPLAARRAVLERDGLACAWIGPDGRRCGSRAWLELDHRRPR